jgi:hypothetical protein
VPLDASTQALTSGLRPFEVLLLALGALLFITLLLLLVVNSLRGKPVAALVPLFFVSVVMIAYPGVQRVKIGSDEVEIEKLTREIKSAQGAPAGAAVEQKKEELRAKISALEQRPNLSPASRLTVAKAQAAVGDVERAHATANELVLRHPEFREAAAFRAEVAGAARSSAPNR